MCWVLITDILNIDFFLSGYYSRNMLTRMDFFHENYKSDNLLINPNTVLKKIIKLCTIMSENDKKRIEAIENGLDPNKIAGPTSDELTRFTLLNQLMFFISIVDRLDDYNSFNGFDCNLFFFALFGLKDCLNKFTYYQPPVRVESKHFTKSITELKKIAKKKGLEEIFNNNKLDKYPSFIRAISFAHTSSTDSAGGFLLLDKQKGCILLNSISPFSATEPPADKPALFFHVLLIYEDRSIPLIFPIYIDEIRNFITAIFNNTNLDLLKSENTFMN